MSSSAGISNLVDLLEALALRRLPYPAMMGRTWHFG